MIILFRWLAFSQRQGPAYVHDDRIICSSCGIGREGFRTKSDFLNHVGGCGSLGEQWKSPKSFAEIYETEKYHIGKYI